VLVKKSTIRRTAVATLGLGLAVSLAACAGGPAPTPTNTYTSTYQAAAATKLAALRGATIAADAANNPSICAKVDNHEDARPQYNLQRADIVFEELVEGGLTRYVACFQSDVPDVIGPVRSIRPMDPDIISPFGGIVAYSGGQQRFVDMMRDTVVYNAIHGQSDTDAVMYRTDDHDAPHNVGVKAQELIAMHADLAAPAQQFAYSSNIVTSSAVRDGTPANTINVVYSDARYPSWTYDAATASYLRSQEGGADMGNDGAQIHATNVIVMRVNIDWQYSPVPRTVMVDSGECFVNTGGYVIHGTWSKADRNAPIVLKDDRGMTIRIAPGNTWIEMPPPEGSVAIG